MQNFILKLSFWDEKNGKETMGVSICPRARRDSLSIQFDTLIICDCRAVINLDRNGVYRVHSKRGAGDANQSTYHEDDAKATVGYIRVFPSSAAEVVTDNHNRIYIRIDGRNYLHGEGIDLLISTQDIDREHHFRLLRDGDEMTL